MIRTTFFVDGVEKRLCVNEIMTTNLDHPYLMDSYSDKILDKRKGI